MDGWLRLGSAFAMGAACAGRGDVTPGVESHMWSFGVALN